MMVPVFLIISILSFHSKPSLEESLEQGNGLSYIQAAEDLLQEGNVSESTMQLVKELYVLAAIIEPMYRESALLGIISIEQDAELTSRLHNLRVQKPMLVSSVIHNKQYSIEAKYDTLQICSTLSSLRKGQFLKTEGYNSLRPWSFLFSDSLHHALQKSLTERVQIKREDITVTLQIELAVLGGANNWSADVATNGDRPVVLNISDDIASLVGVDPTKHIPKNGEWLQR